MNDDIYKNDNDSISLPTFDTLNPSNPADPHCLGGSNQVAHTLKAFETWMRTQDMTHNTMRAYKSRIKGFLIFFETMAKERDLTEEECLNLYLNHLRKLQLVSRSISSFLTAYDAYSMYVRGTVTRITRPTRQGANSKASIPLAPLFDHLNEKGSAKIRAIVHLITFEGLSVGECVALNLKDIVFDEGSVSIRLSAKRRRSSVVLCRRSEVAVLAWLDERLQIQAADPALFISKHGRRISSGGIDFLIRACGHKVFLDISAKTLRTVSMQDEQNLSGMFQSHGGIEFAPEAASGTSIQTH